MNNDYFNEYMKRQIETVQPNGVQKDYKFEVLLWRKRSGIESTIVIDVIAHNGLWAKKWAEESLIGWKAIDYKCIGEVV